ncbi:MAG: hypothetical protein ACE5ES_06015 [Candidatus Nanoarchaeia archaeon]
MVEETILQHWILTRFALPFLLIFFIVFAILEKTKLLGEDKKQINALVAFVVGLIFVAIAYPTEIVSNLILFLTVAIIVVFVALLLWGFVSGEEGKLPGEKSLKIIAGIVIVIAVIIALLWAMGIEQDVFSFLFQQDWSEGFWTNAAFIIVIAAALALIMKQSSG